jgi:hypothetical protein
VTIHEKLWRHLLWVLRRRGGRQLKLNMWDLTEVDWSRSLLNEAELSRLRVLWSVSFRV